MKYIILFVLVFINIELSTAQSTKMDVYLIPGQGADYRLFGSLDLGDEYNIHHVHYSMPDEGMTMYEYAQQLFHQIDTSQQYVLIGVSLGGMLSVEINSIHTPYRTIIISSAKSRNELPGRYRFQKQVPIYKMVSGKTSKKGAQFLQPIVEPDRNNQEDTFDAMLKDKDPDFFKRTIAMIMEWERTDYSENIIHIHGDNDKTIPLRNVKYDYLIEDGSHMMVLTRGAEISNLILDILK